MFWIGAFLRVIKKLVKIYTEHLSYLLFIDIEYIKGCLYLYIACIIFSCASFGTLRHNEGSTWILAMRFDCRTNGGFTVCMELSYASLLFTSRLFVPLKWGATDDSIRLSNRQCFVYFQTISFHSLAQVVMDEFTLNKSTLYRRGKKEEFETR